MFEIEYLYNHIYNCFLFAIILPCPIRAEEVLRCVTKKSKQHLYTYHLKKSITTDDEQRFKKMQKGSQPSLVTKEADSSVGVSVWKMDTIVQNNYNFLLARILPRPKIPKFSDALLTNQS